MPLDRIADRSDHPDWLFELKLDGFRASTYSKILGRAELFKRSGAQESGETNGSGQTWC